MQLTDAEHAQVERIKSKLPYIEAKDPEYKVFGASRWKYQWPEPASEREVAAWEEKHGVVLPREYRIFLRYIANGGPGFAYGLYSLDNTEIYGDIQKESPIPLYMTQQDVDALNARRNPLYGDPEDSEKCLFFDGSLVIMTQGCAFDICLVVTGQHRGRLMQTDGDEEQPFVFVYDQNFLDWYERWLDNFIAGMSMDGFIISVPGNQQQLRAWFATEQISQLRHKIVFSLCRFPQLELETLAFWEHICRTENDTILCEEALIRLRVAKAACIPEIMRMYFETPSRLREIAIENLRYSREANVDVEEYAEPLLTILPQLDQTSFSNAVRTIRKTSHNCYAIYLPFISIVNEDCKRTLLWAMKEAPDFDAQNGYVDLILPSFEASEMETVRWAILSLCEIQDQRIPPLVDNATLRFPEFETLRKNYYRRTWGKKRAPELNIQGIELIR
ncbi:SMI1/KNR4 family protein [Superficieibacter electus]|uniref:SMI1/KNR4 family protein n=2 Tax=Superficieibacter electus TaxID=2022662 RepID=A0A2P5GNA6_9ENTR|nr:SMI1/KNR4 family protein [Superficieibacter electus]POP43574.1 SMI1/KNR4 family protein [Superficieibacter electus]POP48042.1 SMI1/KNR4 family protein [Superficieibacter electus]